EELAKEIKEALANDQTQIRHEEKGIDLTNIKLSSGKFINAALKPKIIVGLKPEGGYGWITNRTIKPFIVTDSGQIIMFLTNHGGSTWGFGINVLQSFEIGIKQLTDLEPDDRDVLVPIYIALHRVAFGITDE